MCSAVNKKFYPILKLLIMGEDPMTSGKIARQLKEQGIELPESTVRYYLQVMDRKGYTQHQADRGRRVTDQGERELLTYLYTQRQDGGTDHWSVFEELKQITL